MAATRNLHIYVDSSVWNGAFDDHAPGMAEQTRRFFEEAARTSALLYLSDMVMIELVRAPEVRRAVLAPFIANVQPEQLQLDAAADELAQAYVAHGVLSDKHQTDARHVAIATIAELDLLVSWNYRHLVNHRRRRAFNAVNVLLGCRPIEIVSPPEVSFVE